MKVATVLGSFIAIGIALSVAGIFYFADRKPLRGSIKNSEDGKTYLIIADDNRTACREILVDGRKWPHPKNVPGEVMPGSHLLHCGGEIQFDIPAGVVFTFDYWGP